MEKKVFKTEVEEEFENDGCLMIAIPGIVIFLIFCILGKLGFAPGEVWAFIKMLMFPSTWDYQMGYEFTHFLRAGLMIGSIAAFGAVVVGILMVIDYIADFFGKRKNFILRVIYLLFEVISKLVLFLASINIIFMIGRIFYHGVVGLFVWLW